MCGSLDFISPFWGDWYFYTYLDYSNIPGCPYNPNANPPSSGYPDAACDGNPLQSIEANDAMPIMEAGGVLTETGQVYQELIAGHFMPEVTAGPAVSPYPIVGKAAQLSVTGTDGTGGSDVSYVWQATGTPPANPQIATPAAATTDVTFSAAGNYSFQVTVTGPDGPVRNPLLAVLCQSQRRGIPRHHEPAHRARNGRRGLQLSDNDHARSHEFRSHGAALRIDDQCEFGADIRRAISGVRMRISPVASLYRPVLRLAGLARR